MKFIIAAILISLVCVFIIVRNIISGMKKSDREYIEQKLKLLVDADDKFEFSISQVKIGVDAVREVTYHTYLGTTRISLVYQADDFLVDNKLVFPQTLVVSKEEIIKRASMNENHGLRGAIIWN